MEAEAVMYTVGILTISDKGSAGLRTDESGPRIKELLPKEQYRVTEYEIVPDEKEAISRALCRLCDEAGCNLVLTTGGTGFAKRDVTPEATLAVMEKNAPGIAEALRAYSFQFTKRAVLSRGMSVIRGNSLIINLPGSTKAVTESMEFLLGTIEHGLDILLARDGECGRQ